jgi:hypothetical protein
MFTFRTLHFSRLAMLAGVAVALAISSSSQRHWPVFFGSAAALFVALNAAFGFLYSLGHEPIANADPYDESRAGC